METVMWSFGPQLSDASAGLVECTGSSAPQILPPDFGASLPVST